MSLTSTTVKVQYNGDGSTVAFAVSFAFWSADDLQVIHRASDGTETVWVRGTHYTVSGGNGSTGTVTVLTSPTDYTPAASETLTIKSNIDDKQNQSLPAGGPLPSSVIEEQLDKIVRMIQQKAEALGRAVGFRLTSQASGFFLPEPAAGEFIRVNSAGTDYEGVALADISGSIDVTLVGLASGDFLQWSGTAWVNKTASEVMAALGAEPADADILKADTSDRITANMGFTPVSDASSSGAVTFDFSTGNICKITLTENITSITLDSADEGDTLKIWITQHASSAKTVSGWPASIKWAGGTAPTMTPDTGAIDCITLEYDGTVYLGTFTQGHA